MDRNLNLQIRSVESLRELEQLEIGWRAVFASDPISSVQQSWPWIRGWAERSAGWLVIAAEMPVSRVPVAFVLLSRHSDDPRSQTLCLGGHDLAAHTAFVCQPRLAEDAIRGFAQFIQGHVQWRTFMLRNVADPRLHLFIHHFSSAGFQISRLPVTPCPRISLPDTWEKYLQSLVGPETRKTLRKKLRRTYQQTMWRASVATPETLDEHASILLELCQRRWGKKPAGMTQKVRSIFTACISEKSLFLVVLWDQNVAVAALAGYLDQKNRVFNCFMTGWNSRYARLSPGITVIATSIHYAIVHRYREYDFGRGAEEYKFLLGGEVSDNQNRIIRHRGMREKVAMAIKDYGAARTAEAFAGIVRIFRRTI